MKVLDITDLPLNGTHLIEASAGTGKTFTLEHLYLRLIIEKSLTVEEILVVTFTRAAVQELRNRLRLAIVHAREALQDSEPAQAEPGDGLINKLLKPFRQDESLVDRLEAAQLSMDQAAISTIHTFCMQLLSDNAFESGQLFDLEIQDRENELQLQAVQEYWRKHYLKLAEEDVAWVHHTLASPTQLLEEIRPLLSANPPTVLPCGGQELYQQQHEVLSKHWFKLRQLWLHNGADIRDLVDSSTALNRNRVQPRTVEKAAFWLDQKTQNESLPSGFPEYLKVFRESHLSSSVKKGQQAPQHALFALVDELWHQLSPLAAQRLAGELKACAAFTRQWLQQSKAKLRVMSYEDLLKHASDAISEQSAQPLRESLRLKYPVALIDEFQDTDPRQYGIFRALYGEREDLAWYMIGDPKQAIYSFRGADINTYLSAAASTSSQFTLGTNWRSTSEMVAAVNHLFSNIEHPFSLHNNKQCGVEFHPVEAGVKTDSKTIRYNGVDQKALRVALLVTDEKPLTKGAADPQAAQLTAALIAEQLSDGRDEKLRLGEQPLRPADIAVLVRSNRQGKLIHEALQTVGVASVITGNDSIFSTVEALHLQRLLQALADPKSERKILRVLASHLGGFDAPALLQLQCSDSEWQQHVNQFVRLNGLLQWRGFLAALLAFMAEYRSAGVLQSQAGGERSLSNYFQLGELLQEAWQERPDIENLQSWLERQCANPGAAGEVSQLRLETDEQLVQIVTVHKSKGLEYPVVYLPFAWSARAPKKNDRVVCSTSMGTCIDLGSESIEKHREHMLAEQLSEEMRLLYVALTRASSQITLLWGDISQAQRTAIASLLGQWDQKMTVGFSAGIQDWVSSCNNAEIISPPEHRVLQTPEATLEPRALICARPPTASWAISSYSALVRKAGGHAELPDHDAGDKLSPAKELPEFDSNSILFFPRGAQAGTFLHYLFEHADFTQPASSEMQKLVRDGLASHGFSDTWVSAVTAMMQQVLEAPLAPVQGLRLCDIESQHRLNEMGFHLPLSSLSCEALLKLLRHYGVMGDQETLEFDTVKGYLTGFVDLIFRFESRYYILDYKSNHLGFSAQDYREQPMRAAMQEHRYDLQYLLYTVALHRYLSTRIKNYSYTQHMGGSFYLFLRGMRAGDTTAPGVFYDKPPLALIDALDQLLSPAWQTAL